MSIVYVLFGILCAITAGLVAYCIVRTVKVLKRVRNLRSASSPRENSGDACEISSLDTRGEPDAAAFHSYGGLPMDRSPNPGDARVSQSMGLHHGPQPYGHGTDPWSGEKPAVDGVLESALSSDERKQYLSIIQLLVAVLSEENHRQVGNVIETPYEEGSTRWKDDSAMGIKTLGQGQNSIKSGDVRQDYWAKG